MSQIEVPPGYQAREAEYRDTHRPSRAPTRTREFLVPVGKSVDDAYVRGAVSYWSQMPADRIEIVAVRIPEAGLP